MLEITLNLVFCPQLFHRNYSVLVRPAGSSLSSLLKLSVLGRRPSVLFRKVALAILLLASVVASVVVTVETFQFHFGVVPQSEVDAGPLPKIQVSCSLS